MKALSLSADHARRVKQRSGALTLANNDDDPAGGATSALPVPAADEQIMAPAEQRHRPWLMQGMRNAL
jgi:hypothetical protein